MKNEKTMHLYILNGVLCDYTPGMAVIAAESLDQARELFLDEFGSGFGDRHLTEFNEAKVTVINSVGLDEAGIVDYVYGGG